MNDVDLAQELLKLAQSDLKAMTDMLEPDVFTDAILVSMPNSKRNSNMIHAVEAEIGQDGQIHLQEPLTLHRRHRAVVMVLEPLDKTTSQKSNAQQVLELLNSPEFCGPPGNPEEMEKTIQENRNAWEE